MTKEDLKSNLLIKVASVLTVIAFAGMPVLALGPVNEAALRSAWSLYTQQKYTASADAFEGLIRESTPSARLYYYAALANRGCNRTARARQLCQYIFTNFPSTQEATYAQKLFPETAQKSAGDALPDSLKGKNIQELMKTAEGRKAVEEALAQKEAATAAAAKISPMLAKSRTGKPGERVFTFSDIAKDGAGGIDQMYYPNCWFESSMSALAALPRGQRLMADMVRYGTKEGTYVVRFPGDGKEYVIDEQKLEKTGVHNKALWATLIEAAQTMKYPDDDGGQLYEGLASLTGQKAEYIMPSSSSDEELSLFIGGAVKSQNPIICGTYPGYHSLVVGGHAYTIIDFDPASSMVKIRNPHGANSRRFSLPNDRNHQKFEQLDDGVFRMHITLFKQYFNQVAKAHI